MSYNVLLTSAGAPNGVGEYWWEHPDTVVSVPSELAVELLHIPSGGYVQVDDDTYKALPEHLAKKVESKKPGLVDSLMGEPTPEPTSPEPPARALADALNLVEAKNTPEPTAKPRGRPRKAT